MNKNYFSLVFGLFLLTLLFTAGCRKDCSEFRTYIKYIPIEKSITDIRNSFSVQPPKELANPKKIYIYDKFLFIVDEFKGFQIVDNSDASNPIPLHFITLDGCTDVSVNDGIVYANQGPDVVSLSFDNGQNINITGRLQNVMNTTLATGDKFIYDYERVEVTEEVACGNSGNWSNGNNSFGMEKEFNIATSDGNSPSTGSGTGGSMARMSFVKGILYIVDNTTLTTVNVSTGFQKLYSGNIGFEVETIFGTETHLYIGTSTGMLIYDRNNGYEPRYVSSVSHARGCDPVVVQGNYAFVTVRGNGNCGQANDELIVVDISTITAPKIHSVHAMNSPYGLGVKGDVLMVCDGTSGLRIFDKSDLQQITENELAVISNVDAYDVIPLDQTFILSTSEGVYQYDYSDVKNPKRLSRIY